MSDLLTPRQAAKLLGVSESTVRRWCDAELVAIAKTAGGHRRIRRQALLRFARGRGMEVLDMAPLATAGHGGRLPASDELSARFYRQVLDEDEKEVQQFALGIVERTGDTARLCDDIIAPAMHRIGEEWSEGHVRIFREHAATRRAAAAVTHVRSRVTSLAANAPVAVCAALPGDPYSLPPAMCGLVLSSAGFRATVLGPDTPAAEILQAAVELSATIVTISVSTAPTSIDELALLCEGANEQGIRIALGGQMLTSELRKQLEPDFFGDSMAHLASYAKRLMNPPKKGAAQS